MQHRLLVLTILATILWLPTFTFAQFTGTNGLSLPFGGRVLTTPVQNAAAVICPIGYGPFTIQSFTTAPFGLFAIPAANLRTTFPQSSGYVLGLYNPIISMSSCINPESGAPIPAFNVNLYGTSVGFGF